MLIWYTYCKMMTTIAIPNTCIMSHNYHFFFVVKHLRSALLQICLGWSMSYSLHLDNFPWPCTCSVYPPAFYPIPVGIWVVLNRLQLKNLKMTTSNIPPKLLKICGLYMFFLWRWATVHIAKGQSTTPEKCNT